MKFRHMVVDFHGAAQPVPWTKPEDIHVDTNQPLPTLGALFNAPGRHVLFGDGRVEFMRDESEEQLRRWIAFGLD